MWFLERHFRSVDASRCTCDQWAKFQQGKGSECTYVDNFHHKLLQLFATYVIPPLWRSSIASSIVYNHLCVCKCWFPIQAHLHAQHFYQSIQQEPIVKLHAMGYNQWILVKFKAEAQGLHTMGQGKTMVLALGKVKVDKVGKADSGFITNASSQVTS